VSPVRRLAARTGVVPAQGPPGEQQVAVVFQQVSGPPEIRAARDRDLQREREVGAAFLVERPAVRTRVVRGAKVAGASADPVYRTPGATVRKSAAHFDARTLTK